MAGERPRNQCAGAAVQVAARSQRKHSGGAEPRAAAASARPEVAVHVERRKLCVPGRIASAEKLTGGGREAGLRRGAGKGLPLALHGTRSQPPPCTPHPLPSAAHAAPRSLSEAAGSAPAKQGPTRTQDPGPPPSL